MKKQGILVVGSANMDLVASAARFPAPGETVLGAGFGIYPGGKGANQAVCAAKLGGDVLFLGKIGDDLFGEKLSRGLKENGVRLDRLLVAGDAPTGTALIAVDGNGENEIIVVPGSNMELLPADVRRARPAFDAVRVLLLQLEIPLATVTAAAEIAHARGAVVVLNPAPARPLPPKLLALVDYLTPNETELGQLSGLPVTGIPAAVRAARALLARGVKNVVVTLGEQGALFVDGTSSRRFPARRVNPVDTTGAGDAFNGALALAIADGRPVGDAIPFANAAAALSVTRRGAQSSMPTMREVRRFLD